jgi:CTP synthase (UTP-ammonia lyase)
MAKRARIALVGDFSPTVVAHGAIKRSFALAIQEDMPLEPAWLGTEKIVAGDPAALQGFAGAWCVPASPYRNTAGALWAIQLAREKQVPFLGTCGGFQHALLEFARNALHLPEAGHTEVDSETRLPLLDRLRCPLVEKTQRIFAVQGTKFAELYGAEGVEGFHCSYGLNPKLEYLLAQSPLEIVAHDAEGDARAFSLKGHRFFVGTLFQPERKALTGSLHPLVGHFFRACVEAST